MINELIQRYPSLKDCRSKIEAAKELIIKTYTNKNKIIVCGNGGSAADSEHIVGELMKGFLSKRRVCCEKIPESLASRLQGALPAISLVSQSAILSAYINDAEPDMMYAQLTYGYANEGDLLICLSTSGNSKNCVNAAMVAKCMGMSVLSMTGKSESRLSEISDVTVNVPETETYKVQELHLPVYHYLCAEAERHFFGFDI